MHVFYISIFIVFVVSFWFLIVNRVYLSLILNCGLSVMTYYFEIIIIIIFLL